MTKRRRTMPRIDMRGSRGNFTMNRLLILAFVLLALSPARGQNLLANGDFEKGLNKEGEPAGWHTRITGVITISEYTDPEHKKGLTGKHFKDGCGYDWGRIRPWPGLFCPSCKQMITTEESGSWYVKNAESVSLGPGRSGQGVWIKMDKATGENQGVRVCSDFIKAERGAGYEIGLDAMVKGVSVQVFLECFQYVEGDKEAKDWLQTLPAEVNPFKHHARLKRTYRMHIYPKAGGHWAHFTEQDVMRENHTFDVMYVSLYAYGGAGEAVFDNVYVRKLSPSEAVAYKRANPVKEDRFRYVEMR